jgi:uncharacterized protein YcbK (DUF882 family)
VPRHVVHHRLPASREVSLYCVHTGERATVEYYDRGRYQTDALRHIARLLRDHRTDEVHPIDPALLDAVHQLSVTLGTRSPLHVVSGYRCEATNEWLRETGYGVAEHSFHTRGRAVDFFLPGRALRDIRRAALRTRAGGVGYYPASGFVHVDTGPVRTWTGVRV